MSCQTKGRNSDGGFGTRDMLGGECILLTEKPGVSVYQSTVAKLQLRERGISAAPTVGNGVRIPCVLPPDNSVPALVGIGRHSTGPT